MKTADRHVTDESSFSSAVEQLEMLLSEQLAFMRKGNMAEVEAIADKAQGLVERLSQSGLLDEPQFRERRERLGRLYDRICLTLSAQMKDVSQSLSRLNKGKKTVTLYHDNM